MHLCLLGGKRDVGFVQRVWGLSRSTLVVAFGERAFGQLWFVRPSLPSLGVVDPSAPAAGAPAGESRGVRCTSLCPLALIRHTSETQLCG